MTADFSNGPDTDVFKLACKDYFYLVDRNFPERGVLKLVGDRYKLDGDQRTVIYRGISSQKRSFARKGLLTQDIANKSLIIDGYNVIFTLINYRHGKPMFISTDNMLRDAGALHGKLRDYSTFESCLDLMIGYLREELPAKIEIYLDAPVSHSVKHAEQIRKKIMEHNLTGDCFVIQSADWALRNAADCILATSDTGIIEKARLPVTDMPRTILQKVYNAKFPDLSTLLSSDQL